MTRFYAPHDVLNMATRDNSALLGMSGPRNPYPGKLGCIEVGAMADLLVVEGDPTLSLDFLKTPESSIKLIMKDGKIYKKDL